MQERLISNTATTYIKDRARATKIAQAIGIIIFNGSDFEVALSEASRCNGLYPEIPDSVVEYQISAKSGDRIAVFKIFAAGAIEYVTSHTDRTGVRHYTTTSTVGDDRIRRIISFSGNSYDCTDFTDPIPEFNRFAKITARLAEIRPRLFNDAQAHQPRPPSP